MPSGLQYRLVNRLSDTRLGRALRRDARGYWAALSLVTCAAVVAVVFRRLPHANLSLLFLLAVLIVAARWGLWPSIVAGLASFVTLNFFFTAPYYTLTVEEEGDVATLVFFLVMATLTGNLAARMRMETANSRAALGRVSTLLGFSRRMATAAGSDEVLQALVDEVAGSLGMAALAFTVDANDGPVERARRDHGRGATPFDIEAAGVEWRAGRTPLQAGWTCLPLQTRDSRAGFVAIHSGELGRIRSDLGRALCEQAAITMERIRLVDDLKAAQVRSESEQLRSALLASVSHDLRTPLASIIGSASSVLEYGDRLEAAHRRDLLQTVLDESQRLNRYIQNLLDMTRLGQPGFVPQRDWEDLNDLIGSALDRLAGALSHVTVDVAIEDDAAVVFVHGALIEQALVNLIDNAAGFAPVGSAIRVRARPDGDDVVIDVVDEGPGIPHEETELVFDMFYRAQQGDGGHQGIGLGLAICRGLVNAHGGTIRALPGDGGTGTRMQIRLPSTLERMSAGHA